MKLSLTLTGILLTLTVPPALAGTFIFAESQDNPDLIAHPAGYDGSGGTLEVEVCIATDSESRSQLEIPVQNVANTWTGFSPELENVTLPDGDLASNEFDVESVLLHEVGHCIGLAHPNLGRKEDVDETDTNFAQTTAGDNGTYDLDDGGDDMQGSRDDDRGDDVNLNWFHSDENDPFLFESEIDADTYSNNDADLPGDSWIEIASLEISRDRGHGDGEGVMNQGTRPQESQRRIHPEDATTIRLGRAGLDRDQGTGDDYDIKLVYGGIADDCDITVRMEGSGFGVCNVSGSFVGSADHIEITEATITLGSPCEINWYFNNSSDVIVFRDRFAEPC